MSTNIEWTKGMKTESGELYDGKTWNPTTGCSEISPGCLNCYAAKMAWRISHMGKKDYEGTVKKLDNKRIVWTGKVNLLEHRLLIPAQTKKPTTWFVDSMSDLFHEDVPFEFIDKVFAVMMLCPQHIFQVLTKRTKRMYEYMHSRQDFTQIEEAAELIVSNNPELFYVQEKFKHEGKTETIPTSILLPHLKDAGWYSGTTQVACGDPESGDYETESEFIYEGDFPAKHIWLGTSIENQHEAEKRGPHLYKLHRLGWMTWISNEPAIGSVNWETPFYFGFLDWLVTGGESGSSARPMHPEWARATRDFCAKNKIPFFFKQNGEYVCGEIYGTDVMPVMGECDKIRTYSERTTDGKFIWYKVGKHKSGRLLDGKLHDAYPIVRNSKITNI